MHMKSWQERIRELREDHDLTQRDVAALLGTTQQVYSRYEQGVNELPSAISSHFADSIRSIPTIFSD